MNTKFAAGDYEGALKASNDAGKWTKIGFFSGIAIGIGWAVMVFLFGVGTAWNIPRAGLILY